MQARMMTKLETIDIALRGDGRGEIGIVEHVRDLRSWRNDQESVAEKRDADNRSIKSGIIGAVILWAVTVLGGAAIAGAKALGWGVVNQAGDK